MKYNQVEKIILDNIKSQHDYIKNLAPQNSQYKGYYRGYDTRDFIMVDGEQVFTNTNNLFNSVDLRIDKIGKNITATTFVDGNRVPYYERAVLYEMMEITLIDGTKLTMDYGENPPVLPISDSYYRQNRNFMYFMKAIPFIKARHKSLDGKVYRVSNGIGEFL